ncbi:MAG TPA: hypothetical protein VNM45_14805 [Bacillus sp. (in: firmicutes)]|nr:hypothetical protein [Bacillus sp. (in: firmicutes)]
MLGFLLLPFLCFIELAAVSLALKGSDDSLDLEDFHHFYHH